jgi:excinuclease ABC subunit C
MVVFINGKPAKNEYRKYKIIVDKNDDYHTMQEVIYRRYSRAMQENTELPDLILVDGGINQIHATKEVLNDLGLKLNVAGLKKDNKHNTNSLIDLNEQEIELDITSNLFHYLTRMQDEVHRFAITYHRQIRSKGNLSSILDNVPNIGVKRRNDLIKHFKTITKIKEASLDELTKIIPKDTAINLQEYLKSLEEKHENN